MATGMSYMQRRKSGIYEFRKRLPTSLAGVPCPDHLKIELSELVNPQTGRFKRELTGLLGDYLAVKGFSLAGTAGATGQLALQKLLNKRLEAARKELLDSLSKGKINVSDIPEDDLAAIVFRHLRAAEEGAARLNLKLMASVIAGSVDKPDFYANDFLLWADALASLKRDEVLVLGVMHRVAAETDYDIQQRTGEFWGKCLPILKDKYGMEYTWAEIHAAALMRTGLVRILGGLMDTGQAFLPSPDLRKLGEMVDIESAYSDTPYGYS
ncbi:hypothetical protein [Rhizobium sp. PAMB 3182]